MRTFSLVFILLLVVTVSCPASAWSNGGYSSGATPDIGTHDTIAEKALGAQEGKTFVMTDRYLLGTEAPDNPKFIGDTTEHHIYYSKSGVMTDDSSAQRARAMELKTIEYLNKKDYSNASFYLGAMTHYISDVGVFGHTMGASTAWGAESHHSDYEEAISSISPGSITVGNTSAYDSATTLAYKVTFGSGAIQSNTWMDENYSFDDSKFIESAKASLTAAISAAASAIHRILSTVSIPEFGDISVVILAALAVIFISKRKH